MIFHYKQMNKCCMQWSRRSSYQCGGEHAIRFMWRYSFTGCHWNGNDQER